MLIKIIIDLQEDVVIILKFIAETLFLMSVMIK